MKKLKQLKTWQDAMFIAGTSLGFLGFMNIFLYYADEAFDPILIFAFLSLSIVCLFAALIIVDGFYNKLFLEAEKKKKPLVVEIEPNQGEWKVEVPDKIFKCSVCGRLTVYDTNYCPDCGAYMKGEK